MSLKPVSCPALLVSAPASGQGKTSVTAALARMHRNQGRTVRVFKTGPDYLDPMILEAASGAPVYQLDLFMAGEDQCRRLLWEAAQVADLILIEGVMGLFDGTPSSADLAETFGVQVLGVIDAGGMAQTFAAMAHGLMTYRPTLNVAGVLANRVGSPGHGIMLRECLADSAHWYGALPRDEAYTLPERHLGLVQAAQLVDLNQRLDAAAHALQASLVAAEQLPPAVSFTPPQPQAALPELNGVQIGVARDAAFSFIYPANLELLERMGAQLKFFSPLAGDRVPEADSLWLPGGYPELYAQQLSSNRAFHQQLQAFVQAGKPVLAECGGMLMLAEQLELEEGHYPLAAILPGKAQLHKRLQAIALQQVEYPQGQVRGHSFHYSSLDCALEPVWQGECPNGRKTAEPVYAQQRLVASYIHHYFPSNPVQVAAWFTP